MKKILLALLICSLALVLMSCGSSDKSEEPKEEETTAVQAKIEETTASREETTEAIPVPKEGVAPVPGTEAV